MPADPAALERIALTRLPELQGADGLFHPATGGNGSTVRATAIALIGLSREEEAASTHGLSVGALRTGLLGSLSDPALGTGDLALALWAESRTDGSAIDEVTARIRRRMPARFDRLPLEDLALLASATSDAATIGSDPSGLDELLGLSVDALLGRIEESGLFLDAHHRIGAGLGPIGAQFLALNALRSAGEGAGVLPGTSQSVAAALAGLQRSDGAWPHLIETKKGGVAELFPVLTVDQIALSALSLRGLEDGAVERSFDWAEGNNPLGFSLIHPAEARIDHGVVPKRRTGALARGVGRASRKLGKGPAALESDDLILDPLVTAEDLGWVLEAWAGRTA